MMRIGVSLEINWALRIGVFSPANEFSYYRQNRWVPWPPGMADLLVKVESIHKVEFPYDLAIYLYYSTCREEASMTMTLAHELQHSIQHEIDFNTWAFNTLIFGLRPETTAACGLQWEDIPTERDARIVAKRVTETLVGREKTDLYIEQRLAEATKDIDVADWNFIRNVDTSEPYNDLPGETRRLFQRLAPIRTELENILLQAKKDPEMAGLDLSMVMDGS
jgi:hypothetical protein